MPRTKLTDKEEQKIISVHAENGNISLTAEVCGVSRTTVRNVLNRNIESVKKFHEKKEQNTIDLFDEMDKLNSNVLSIHKKALQRIFHELDNTKDIQRIAITTATLIDKHTKFFEVQFKKRELDIKDREVALREREQESADNSVLDAYLVAMLGGDKNA